MGLGGKRGAAKEQRHKECRSGGGKLGWAEERGAEQERPRGLPHWDLVLMAVPAQHSSWGTCSASCQGPAPQSCSVTGLCCPKASQETLLFRQVDTRWS